MGRDGATLVVTEVGAPNNMIFNWGVGGFEIRWIESDGWVEGTGRPIAPTTDGVSYQSLALALNPAVDAVARLLYQRRSGRADFVSVGADGGVGIEDRGRNRPELVSDGGGRVGGVCVQLEGFHGTNWRPSLTITAVREAAATDQFDRASRADQVVLRFNTVSNWNYTVQGLAGLAAGSSGAWSNLFTVPAKPIDDQAVYADAATKGQRCYRLLLSRQRTGR